MQRIGLAASKIAKGNLLWYNLFVLLLTFLFSSLIFFVGGAAILCAFLLLAVILHGVMPTNFEKEWISIMVLCMIALAMLVGVFSLAAISKNIKFKR